MEYIILTPESPNFLKMCTECEENVVLENLRVNGGTLNFHHLTYESDFLIVCVNQNKPIGFVSIVVNDNEYYVYQIAVKKEFKRKGIATTLINKVKELGDDIFITAHVRSYNNASQKLFSSNGFINIKEYSSKDNLLYVYRQKTYGENKQI